MFYLYEEEEEEEVEYYSPPPDGDIDGLAGLAGYGGRL